MRLFFPLYILAFALAAFFAAEARLWALAHVAPVAHLLLLLALVGLILFASRFFVKSDMRAGGAGGGMDDALLPDILRRGPVSIAFAVLLGLGAMPLFHYFRMGLFLPPPAGLGDSLQLIENIPVFAQLFGYLDSFDDLLSLFIRSKSYLLFAGPDSPGLPAQTALGLPSTIAGGFFVAMVWLFLKSRPLPHIFAGLALFIMTPAIQLFFGYVENYTLVTLYITLLLMLVVSRPQLAPSGKAGPGVMAGLGLLAAWAVLHHIIAGFLLPCLVYLVYARSRDTSGRLDRGLFLKTALWAGGAGAILLGLFWAYFLFITDNPVIFADSHVAHPPYLHPRKVFSTRHVLNVLNQFLFIAPVAIALLWGTLGGALAALFKGPGGVRDRLRGMRDILAPDTMAAFLGIAVLSFLFDAFLHNPVIGYPADWDLMTMFGMPLNVYAFYMFTRKSGEQQDEKRPGTTALILLLAFAAILTTSWIRRNTAGGPTSDANLVRAEKMARKAVKTISGSPVYQGLKTKHRRKQYVRIELFLLRSELLLSSRGDARAREILAALRASRPRFARVMALPDSEFKPAFAKLWNDLARLNQRIAGLESPF